jgi:Flp pilus assembly protein TadG
MVRLETAMVLPLLLFLLVIGIEFGRIVWFRSMLNQAAAVGAELASLPGTSDSQIVSAVRARLAARGIENILHIGAGPRQPGRPVAVTVEADVDFLLLPDTGPERWNVTRLSAKAVETHVN